MTGIIDAILDCVKNQPMSNPEGRNSPETRAMVGSLSLPSVDMLRHSGDDVKHTGNLKPSPQPSPTQAGEGASEDSHATSFDSIVVCF